MKVGLTIEYTTRSMVCVYQKQKGKKERKKGKNDVTRRKKKKKDILLCKNKRLNKCLILTFQSLRKLHMIF